MANHKRKHRKWYSSCRLCKGDYKYYGGNRKARKGIKGQMDNDKVAAHLE